MSNWGTWSWTNPDNWVVALVTEQHIFYRDFSNAHYPHSCTKVYTRKMEFVACDVDATNLFIEALNEIYQKQVEVLYMHPRVAKDMFLMEQNGKFNVQNIRKIVNSLDMSNLICTSFDVARNNGRRKNIVIIGETDVYLTYKYKDQFGEFVCWVEDEFNEDASVYESLRGALRDYYSLSEKEMDKKIERKEFFFDFKPYDN